jgi:Pilus formation protein N terminal region
MTARFKRDGRRRRQHGVLRAVLMTALFFATAMATGAVRAEDIVTVYLDQAKVMKLPDRVASLVIGNPLIADVTLQRGGMIIITGKGYGITNMIALDPSGAILREQSIEVRGAREDVVVVYRGANRESYSCTPICERRITLGDTPEFFEATLGESGDRNSRAQGSASTSQQPR